MIFIVDDERVIAYTLGIILARVGFDTHVFTCAAEALTAAAEQAPRHLITDIHMPAMSGFQLAERMRLLHPKCTVSFISGAIPHLREDTVLRESRFFDKPFSPVELITYLEQIGLRSERHSPVPPGLLSGGASLADSAA